MAAWKLFPQISRGRAEEDTHLQQIFGVRLFLDMVLFELAFISVIEESLDDRVTIVHTDL